MLRRTTPLPIPPAVISNVTRAASLVMLAEPPHVEKTRKTRPIATRQAPSRVLAAIDGVAAPSGLLWTVPAKPACPAAAAAAACAAAPDAWTLALAMVGGFGGGGGGGGGAGIFGARKDTRGAPKCRNSCVNRPPDSQPSTPVHRGERIVFRDAAGRGPRD